MTHPRSAARPAIDWAHIHQVLETTQAAISRAEAPPPAEGARILEARARDLAAAPAGERDETALTVIAFQLGDETYALAVGYLREVYPLKDLTPLPGTPAFVCGIINLRGQIRSVIDLQRFLDLPAPALAAPDQVLIVQAGAMELGIMVDRVLGMQQLPPAALQPAPPTLAGRGAAYCHGVTAAHMTVLDAGALLADPALRVDDAT
ncbi:MAG TPA: chemotaxis protein CheW [Chloroflexia bacterium]|nr:chemotaxis protein CheW [Chloroflexia bacterium]